MANKKTQKDLFMELRDLATEFGTNEQVEFIDKKIEQVEKKNANKGATAKQVENENLKDIIVDTLKTLETSVRISEIQNANETLATLSNQRISALLKQLVDTKVVEKTIEKRIAKFRAI